jgi:hypothetical protein
LPQVMKVQDVRALVKEELKRYPRGGASQNLFRAVYEMTRLHGLSRKSTIPGTPEAAHDAALETVRKQHPDFEPRIIDPGYLSDMSPSRSTTD